MKSVDGDRDIYENETGRGNEEINGHGQGGRVCIEGIHDMHAAEKKRDKEDKWREKKWVK